jgi:hypothetical protein
MTASRPFGTMSTSWRTMRTWSGVDRTDHSEHRHPDLAVAAPIESPTSTADPIPSPCSAAATSSHCRKGPVGADDEPCPRASSRTRAVGGELRLPHVHVHRTAVEEHQRPSRKPDHIREGNTGIGRRTVIDAAAADPPDMTTRCAGCSTAISTSAGHRVIETCVPPTVPPLTSSTSIRTATPSRSGSWSCSTFGLASKTARRVLSSSVTWARPLTT